MPLPLPILRHFELKMLLVAVREKLLEDGSELRVFVQGLCSVLPEFPELQSRGLLAAEVRRGGSSYQFGGGDVLVGSVYTFPGLFNGRGHFVRLVQAEFVEHRTQVEMVLSIIFQCSSGGRGYTVHTAD